MYLLFHGTINHIKLDLYIATFMRYNLQQTHGAIPVLQIVKESDSICSPFLCSTLLQNLTERVGQSQGLVFSCVLFAKYFKQCVVVTFYSFTLYVMYYGRNIGNK